jgi:hypothetical protein
MHRRYHRILLILAFVVIVCHLRVSAQEGEEPDRSLNSIPESERSEEQKREIQEEWDAVLKGIPTRHDNAAELVRNLHARREDLYPGRPLRPSTWDGPFPPTSYVTFGPKEIWIKTSGFGSIDYGVVTRGNPYLRRWLDKGDVFVLKGDVTRQNEEWIKELGQTVTVSKLSPKRTDGEAARAATLALRPFKPEQAVVMNGLPYETEAGQAELARMGLHGTPEGWRSARREIRSAAAAGHIPIKVATRKVVLQELREGQSNVLFVIAHSDSNAIFLPGVAGGKITMQELESIRRDVAPDRAIVLLACKTGGVNGATQSIAETLIKNRLASVVFASDEFIHTKDVAEMLRNLRQGSMLGQVFESLRAIVRVDEPEGPWERAKPSEAFLIVRRMDENA